MSLENRSIAQEHVEVEPRPRGRRNLREHHGTSEPATLRGPAFPNLPRSFKVAANEAAHICAYDLERETRNSLIGVVASVA